MNNFSDQLSKFQQSQKFTDVSFELDDGSTVRCHKPHLAAFSIYLKLLFKYQDGDNFRMPACQFNIIFDWAYNNAAPEDGTYVETILHADYLGAATLIEKCTVYFLKQVYSVDFGWLFQMTCLQTPLQPCIIDYLADNFKAAFTNSAEEFCRLPFDVLVNLLQSKSFRIYPESFLWTAIKQWVFYDKEQRKPLINDLVSYIKLGLLPMSQFRQIRCELVSILEDEKIGYDSELFDNIHNLQRWKQSSAIMDDSYTENVFMSIQTKMYSPRIPKRCAVAIGGWCQALPSSKMEMYNHKADVWYKLPFELPCPRAYQDCVCIDNYLYVVGGFAGDERFKTMTRLNLTTFEWKEMPPLHRERCFVSIAAIEEKIYCMGGYDGANEAMRLSSSEMFDPETNQWVELADLLEPRSDAAAVTYNGKIYMLGGFNGNDYLDTVEMYDPEVEEWVRIASMQKKRGGVGGVVFKDKLYALGGCDGEARLKSVECLDLRDKKAVWEYAPSMTIGRSNFGVCAVNDRIIVAGGYIHPSTTNRIEWFDGFQWNDGAEMSKLMSAFVLTTILVTPELAEAIEEESQLTLTKKKARRLSAVRQMSSNGEFSVEEFNRFAETDSDSQMFDSFLFND